MPPLISIESVAASNPVEILRVDTGNVAIGRDPDNHIVVDSDAVSRFHGCLVAAHNHWIYRDYESTNGSWVNGVKLEPGQMRLVRNGDVIQLADFPMRVSHVAGSPSAEPSVLVFYDDHFEGEFPVSDSGALFRIGGEGGDFYIQGVDTNDPQLEVSNHAGRLQLRVGASPVAVLVNGTTVSGAAVLSDRDEVLIGLYRVFVNDISSGVHVDKGKRPSQANAPMEVRPVQAYDRPHLPEHLRKKDEEEEWESEAARRKALSGKRFVFGSDPAKEDVTGTADFGDEFHSRLGFEMSASQRFSRVTGMDEGGAVSPAQEKTLIAFGVMVFVLILIFVAYLFSMIA